MLVSIADVDSEFR